MNFFSRHKKTLARYATYPLLALAFIAAGFVFFRPAQVSWYAYLGDFFGSPLGMALQLVVVATMLAYQIYHRLNPATPRHRAYFAAAALFAGLIADGVYDERLSHTADFTSASGSVPFFAAAIIFYCIYRLVIIIPERERRGVTAIIAALLFFHLIVTGYGVYGRMAASAPCPPNTQPGLWSLMVYPDPQQHCAAE